MRNGKLLFLNQLVSNFLSRRAKQAAFLPHYPIRPHAPELSAGAKRSEPFFMKSLLSCNSRLKKLRLLALCIAVAACAGMLEPVPQAFARDGLRQMVAQKDAAHGVPPALAHAVVILESRYRPRIVSKGNYGLMQIRLGTARAMGFRGSPRQLLQPETNLRYGMKYLARAWRASRGNGCGTIKRYQTGTGAGRYSRATLTYCARARRIMASR